VIKYFTYANPARDVHSSLLENIISMSPISISKNPCAMSPNITPNRKGKDIVVKTAGLNSL